LFGQISVAAGWEALCQKSLGVDKIGNVPARASVTQTPKLGRAGFNVPENGNYASVQMTVATSDSASGTERLISGFRVEITPEPATRPEHPRSGRAKGSLYK
jgi:hypothetical protein